ncbi:hypothetical protein EJ08DRAFT_194973 [Tothia fuscella]|uniref:LysM domain-containing protein n=1 Tax=Tothia fuscella TaxID=1048955 RepID=A0A9P4NTA2_9PEZI|nr:hypothetical protein EJ08DRAFT_194973 [Tothia fuscella]
MSLFYYTLLAAGSLPTLVLGAPVSSTPLARFGTVVSSTSTFLKRGADVYKMFVGNGESSWPGTDQWISSFDELFENNREIINGGCTQFHVAANSDEETNNIAASIKQVAGETGVDSRFILTIMLQESNGCVRAPTSNYGVRNPGLMQSHDGAATCNDRGNVQNPCPTNTILQMVRDGVAGTAAGDGLVQTLKQATGSDATKYYRAARMYNSGSIHISGDLGSGIATHCYSSDVANRLLGWVYANKACSLDGGSAAPSVPVAPEAKSKPISPAPTSQPATPAPIQAAPSPAVKQALPPAPVASNPAEPKVPSAIKMPNANNNNKAVSAKMAPGVTTECSQYYNVQAGDFCHKVGEEFNISFDKFRSLNTAVDGNCSNLWLGYDYCVKSL